MYIIYPRGQCVSAMASNKLSSEFFVGLMPIVCTYNGEFNEKSTQKYLRIWIFLHFYISLLDTSVPGVNSITNVFASLCP